MYFHRDIDQELVAWKQEKEGKPLLLRGARQVGKSSAVRELARQFDYFLEVNFEEQRQVHSLFEGDLDPRELAENLSIFYNIPVLPGKTLIFFDEIQACVPAISSLRFFYEKFTELHIIAAGSLLEFALAETPSFGVGRVRSLFMYPLSFDEYLVWVGEEALLNAKRKATPQKPLSEPIHQKLLAHLRRFMVIGGMPEVVASYLKHGDLLRCGHVLDDLITSLKADFVKYKKRVPFLRISEVFDSVVRQSGSKFVYNNAATEANHKQIREAVELLIMSGLVVPVTHSSANGLPLGAETNIKKRKLFLLDTGVVQRLLGLNIAEILLEYTFEAVNKGAIAEQYVGLELLKAGSRYRQEELYYWHREAKSSNAEVDYLLAKNGRIIPLEVKSGKKGTMQSLFLFLTEKKVSFGVRFSLENYSSYENISVFPLYAVSDFVKL